MVDTMDTLTTTVAIIESVGFMENIFVLVM